MLSNLDFSTDEATDQDVFATDCSPSSTLLEQISLKPSLSLVWLHVADLHVVSWGWDQSAWVAPVKAIRAGVCFLIKKPHLPFTY